MTDDQIKHMVNRFLSWKLPRDTFNPDCGISFNKAPINTHTPWPSQHEPSGTNLFDVTQANAMVRRMIEGMPAPADAEPVAYAVHSPVMADVEALNLLQECRQFIADAGCDEDDNEVVQRRNDLLERIAALAKLRAEKGET
jgi:hypothetical protein